MNKKANWIQ